MSVWRFGNTGLWKGEIKWEDGTKSSVIGASKAEAESRMMLRASGVKVNRDHNQSYRISIETVRYALSLILPLHHLYREQRQRQGVDVLEAAIRHAKANVEYTPPELVSNGTESQQPQRDRTRPAWLAALPTRAEA